MHDMNAKVGSEHDPLKEIVRGHGLRESNERTIRHTWFHHHRHLYTWKSPGDCVRNQIDYITINRRLFRHSIHQVKGHPETDYESDHVPIVATMKV